MFHGGAHEKKPPTCLCGQAEAGHGGSEGDLVKGTEVGMLVILSARADRPFDEEARSDDSRRGGMRQPWEPLRTVQRTYGQSRPEPGDERMQLCYRV